MVRRLRDGIPPTVVALGLVSFLTDLSSDMIYPLVPVFLQSELGATAAALGLIEGLAESTASISKVLSGLWTDRIRRRKPFVLVGYGLAGAVRPLMGFATSWVHVASVRVVDRLGKGLRTSPRDALIADVTSEEHRGAAYGLHRAMDDAGALLGPVVAAVLVGAGLGLRGVFWLAVIPAVVVVAVIVVAVREPPGRRSGSGGRVEPIRWGWREMGRDYWWLLAAVFVFTLGNSADAFLLLRLSDAGVTAAGVALLWGLLNGVKMIASVLGGRLSDLLGRKPLELSGWAVYALVYGGMAVFTSLPVLVGLFLVYGISFGLTEPVERAWVAGLVPERLRGSAFGYYHAAVGLGALPASVIFGGVWVTTGPGAAFLLGATLAGIAATMLIRVPDPGPRAASVARRGPRTTPM
ncbi:MAG TPA: MFS transporter [Actinobacteria bacterium]|nr:MFS transporter [Actinomycetota bacterium]